MTIMISMMMKMKSKLSPWRARCNLSSFRRFFSFSPGFDILFFSFLPQTQPRKHRKRGINHHLLCYFRPIGIDLLSRWFTFELARAKQTSLKTTKKRDKPSVSRLLRPQNFKRGDDKFRRSVRSVCCMFKRKIDIPQGVDLRCPKVSLELTRSERGSRELFLTTGAGSLHHASLGSRILGNGNEIEVCSLHRLCLAPFRGRSSTLHHPAVGCRYLR